jgi:hypothetical protein
VQQNANEIELVGSRFSGQKRRWANLGGQAKIDHPNFTRI